MPITTVAPPLTPAARPRRRGSKAPIVAFAVVVALLVAGAAVVLLTGGGDGDGVESAVARTDDKSVDQDIVAETTDPGVPLTTEIESEVTVTGPAQVIPTTLPPPPPPEATDAPLPDVPALVPGDLGLAQPMARPPCDDTYITILASAIDPATNASIVASVLESYPGTAYLKTVETCPSLRPSLDGAEIYVVYLGPFLTSNEACAARSTGPSDSYVRILSLTVPDTHRVTC